MSAGEPDGGYGTVYHPGPDLTPNGDSQGIAAGQLRSLPRRRRPGMIALAVALVGAGILASAALYQHEDHQLPVLVVTANVPAGSVISAADVATTSVAAGPGVQTVPAGPLRQAAARSWCRSRSARRDCRPAAWRQAISSWWCPHRARQAARLAAAQPPKC